jgi:hypothetical protein
MTKKIA